MSGVARVQVALRRRYTDGTCKWWNGARWVPRNGCADRRWLGADGTDRWSYGPSRLLGRSEGTRTRNYRLYSRAFDGAGNDEQLFERGRNVVVFEVI